MSGDCDLCGSYDHIECNCPQLFEKYQDALAELARRDDLIKRLKDDAEFWHDAKDAYVDFDSLLENDKLHEALMKEVADEMSEELKACPFCGHESMLFIHKEEGDPFSWVSCPICGTNGPCPDGDKWNARPIEDGLRAEIARLKNQVTDYLAVNAELVDKYERLQAERRWIPFTEERPPEDETRYTAITVSGVAYWAWLPPAPESEGEK